MGKIYCIIGKSGTGKDTVLGEILKINDIETEKIVPYTTRPMRDGEVEGINYHYVSKEQLNKMKENGQVIECRSYNTVFGEWNYFTASAGISDDKDYILITTQKALPAFFNYYGDERIHVLYLKLDNKIRLERCINRESQQDKPNYSEVCRRYLADEDDFDEQALNSYKHCSVIDTCGNVEEYTNRIAELIKATKHTGGCE